MSVGGRETLSVSETADLQGFSLTAICTEKGSNIQRTEENIQRAAVLPAKISSLIPEVGVGWFQMTERRREQKKITSCYDRVVHL